MSHVALRVDAGATIGAGHLSRMSSVAAVLDSRGHSYEFLIKPESYVPFLNWGISDSLIKVFDPDSVSELIGAFDCVFVDICHAGNIRSVQSFVDLCLAERILTVVIDSMPPDHFECDIRHKNHADSLTLVTPYHDAQKFRPPIKLGRWLFGSRYAILSEDYREIRSGLPYMREKRLLVVCGGSDPDDLSLKILHVCREFEVPTCFVIGSMFSAHLKGQLEQASATVPHLTTVSGLTNLAFEISRSSHVVGKIGLIRYETAALGRHGIFLSEFDGYRDYLSNFSSSGLGHVFFGQEDGQEEQFLGAIRSVLGGSEAPNMCQTAMDIVDTDGVFRILNSVGL